MAAILQTAFSNAFSSKQKFGILIQILLKFVSDGPFVSTKPNLVAKIWPPNLVTICAWLPKLVANVSSQLHHLVITGLAVSSLVRWLPLMVAHTCKLDTISVVYIWLCLTVWKWLYRIVIAFNTLCPVVLYQTGKSALFQSNKPLPETNVFSYDKQLYQHSISVTLLGAVSPSFLPNLMKITENIHHVGENRIVFLQSYSLNFKVTGLNNLVKWVKFGISGHFLQNIWATFRTD